MHTLTHRSASYHKQQQLLFSHMHTHKHTKNLNTLWSLCLTEQVPVSLVLLPFPSCNTIHMLPFVCVCVFPGLCMPACSLFFQSLWMDANAHTGVLSQVIVCTCVHVHRCAILCVWGPRGDLQHPRWQTHRAEVEGLCSCRTVQAPISSYQNIYRSEPPILNPHLQ